VIERGEEESHVYVLTTEEKQENDLKSCLYRNPSIPIFLFFLQ